MGGIISYSYHQLSLSRWTEKRSNSQEADSPDPGAGVVGKVAGAEAQGGREAAARGGEEGG